MAILVVKQDGTGDYTGIQAAVDASSSGDTVEIQDSGIYNESISPNQAVDPITLRAGSGNKPVLDGENTLVTGVTPDDGWSVEGLEIKNYTANGVYGSFSSPKNFKCNDLFVHDVGFYGIGGISGSSQSDQAEIERCKVFDSGKSGIYVRGDWVNVENNLIVRPGSGWSGIFVDSPYKGIVNNCTVAGFGGSPAAGVSSSSTGSVVKNTIVKAGSSQPNYGIDSPSYDHCCAAGSYSVAAFINGAGQTDITSDPVFISEAEDDYRLQDTSPCVDAGDTISAITTDITGLARPQDQAYEIGAYELPEGIYPIRVDVIGRKSIAVRFNEAPRALADSDLKDALTRENWTLKNINGDTIQTVDTRASSLTNTIELQFTDAIESPGTYTITASDSIVSQSNEVINPAFLVHSFSNGIFSRQSERMESPGKSTLRDFMAHTSQSTLKAGSLMPSSAGDYLLSEGVETLDKLIMRRLMMSPGDLYHAPGYGVGAKLKDLWLSGQIMDLKQEIKNSILKEPEIDEVGVTLESDTDGILFVTIRAVTANGIEIPGIIIPISTHGEL